MTMHRLVLLGLLGTSLAIGGCDSGSKKKEAKKEAATKDAKKGVEPASGDLAAKPAEDGADDGAKGGADDADEALDDRVVKAASLAKKIEADPTKTDQILADAGMDRAAFEALIYEVSAPELADQYRLAMARDES